MASKPVLARRTTKGPLDGDDDPLSSSKASIEGLQPSPIAASPNPSDGLPHDSSSPAIQPSPIIKPDDQLQHPSKSKDLSFLLEAGIYHPLAQVDIPAPFRKPFPPPLAADTTPDKVFSDIEGLLAECHFLGAANLCALALTSKLISPGDHDKIFRLLAIRYSCLELSGNTLLAAQEAKALEDLSSAFYYLEDTLPGRTASLPADQRPLPVHIMPFELRVQAVRLQSIGFSDPRRGISALYDLGLECREHLSSSLTEQGELTTWENRLEEIGVRVVNALIETGDLDCAGRTLSSMISESDPQNGTLMARYILLALKMGNLEQAEEILDTASLADQEQTIMRSLLQVAGGQFELAVESISSKLDEGADSDLKVIARQNLAIAYLYTGQLSKCKAILETLVDEQHGFPTLATNLATVYELSSDKARNLKITLADRLAEKEKADHRIMYINADLKL